MKKEVKLDIKDLMVGDWVIVLDSYDGPCKIETLGEVDVDTDGLDEVEYDRLRPIPITPEILEKNGFEEMPKDKFGRREYCYAEFLTDIETIDVSLTENKSNPKYNWTINISNPAVFSGRGFINYVHELQHALRLCGVDKEIEL